MQRRMSGFELYLRTGRRLAEPYEVETKFNPWHDPDDGRFTFARQGRYDSPGQSRSNDASAATDRARADRPARTTISQAPTRRIPSKTPRQISAARAGRPIVSAPPTRPTPRQLGSNQNSAVLTQNPKEALERIGKETGTARNAAASIDLVQRFKQHMIPKERDRNDVYPDSRGIPTVGIGHKVVPSDRLKIGDQISDARKEAFWRQDSASALQAARQQMNEARIRDADFLIALADVNFQLGRGWRTKFKGTWALILAGDYVAAAREARDSKWFKQTPDRVEAFQKALLALTSKRTPKG